MANYHREMVVMRDGVKLGTHIWIPEGEGPWPTMFMRSPYGLGMMGDDMFTTMNGDGYVAIFQDERGRFDSEGEWAPRKHSGRDGADTCDWIASQSWSNGKIGLWGASYAGITQWLTAIEGPISVKSMSPMVSGDAFAGFPYISPGVLSMSVALGWGVVNIGPNTCERCGKLPDDVDVAHALDVQAQSWEHLAGLMSNRKEVSSISPEALATLQALGQANNAVYRRPLAEIVSAVNETMPWVKEWVEHPEPEEPYWSSTDWGQHFDAVLAPTLIVAGWYDLFIRSAPRDFAELAKRDPSGKKQKLVIGPWAHNFATNMGAIFAGERQFPWSSENDSWSMGGTSQSNEVDLLKRWHAHWLKDEENGITNGAPVKLYVMGENVLRDEYEWPLARTEWTCFYLHSYGKANTALGNGGLSTDKPEYEVADQYAYDPADPVPSAGGRSLDFANWGCFDQQEVEKREDVLVYSTLPLEQDLEVTGPIVLKLWVTTSAVDTDFTGKLVDVQPDGTVYNLCDGITRLRFRKEQKGLVTPGELQQVTIELGPTSNLFKKGHKLRLEVSSSNFPYADPNPNTGKSLFLDESNAMVVAQQTVYHDASRPSHLILPVIPR